jgi:hypothetical protein
MKSLFKLGLIGALISCPLYARTWKSADGTKSFEGTLRSYDKNRGTVSVVTNEGKLLNFNQSFLSGEDREFLVSQEAAKSTPAQPADFTAELEKTKVGKQVSDAKLKLVEKKGFASAKLAKAPEFYILYFSASW